MTKEQIYQHGITISPLDPSEASMLEPILREHVRNRLTGDVIEKEVQSILSWMKGELDVENGNRERKYFVAKDDAGRVLGCVGITEAADYHLSHHQITDEDTAEMVNFFVAGESQGKGVGRRLFNTVVNEARKVGKKHLVLDSGPRYKRAWPMYEHMFGHSGSMIEGLYGRFGDAMTWKMDL